MNREELLDICIRWRFQVEGINPISITLEEYLIEKKKIEHLHYDELTDEWNRLLKLLEEK